MWKLKCTKVFHTIILNRPFVCFSVHSNCSPGTSGKTLLLLLDPGAQGGALYHCCIIVSRIYNNQSAYPPLQHVCLPVCRLLPKYVIEEGFWRGGVCLLFLIWFGFCLVNCFIFCEYLPSDLIHSVFQGSWYPLDLLWVHCTSFLQHLSPMLKTPHGHEQVPIHFA